MTVLSFDQVTKTYQDFWRRPIAQALKPLTLELQAGEIFGLLGPNGSGKSTTIKLLLGLIKPTSGTISVLGQKPGHRSVREVIGYLPEISYLHPFLTARETLAYYGALFNLPKDTLDSRIDQLLKMVKLDDVKQRPVGTYSKGMTRRLGLAQALINRPSLLILDEPTSGLDPVGTREVKDLILALKQTGVSILMSSHLLADVADCCDRIAILNQGSLCGMGAIDELLQDGAGNRLTLETYFLQQIGQSHATFEPADFLVK